MTTYNKTTLKTFFETNDVPGGQDYANLIDSQVNIVETAQQSMAGPLSTTELITPRVSAGNMSLSGTFSAQAISGTTGSFSSKVSAASLNVAGAVSAGSLATGAITGTTLSLSGTASAASLNVSGDVSAVGGTVYASATRGGRYFSTVLTVSAAGTTQATGALLGGGICNLKGITDDANTGFTLLANLQGLQQTLWVSENTSCNLWPCNDGKINALATNAAFAMAGNTTYIVTHIGASAYTVK